MITQSYKIDMTSGAVPIRIKVSQYDAGVRQLVFQLYNLGQALTSSNVGNVTAYMQGTKPDKKGFEYSCTSSFTYEGCFVTVQITEQMTACAGDVECELVLLADDIRIGSANFVLDCERAALGEDADISETELPDIIDMGRQYAAAAEDAAERAEAAADGGYSMIGMGQTTSYTNKVADTNVYMRRAPKVGDRFFINFTHTVTDSDAQVKVYKEYGGTAYSLSFAYWTPGWTLEGLCLLEVVESGLGGIALTLKYSFKGGTTYTAGTGIDITGSAISNTMPNYGENIDGGTISSVSSGNLGTYVGESKFLIMSFSAAATPYSGGYTLTLSYTGGAAIMESAALYNTDGTRYAENISAGVMLICEVTNTGSGTSADPVHVNVIGVIDPNGGGASSLADLTDTNISSPTNGQVLGYNSTSGKWENQNAPSGGGSTWSNVRYTISASSWSASPNASGYYTYTVNLSTNLSTAFAPIVSCAGSTDNLPPTDAEKAAYSLIDYYANPMVNSMALWAKTKPTTTFCILVRGVNA